MSTANEFSHFDHEGRPQMVDVSAKPDSEREARARAIVRMRHETRTAIEQRAVAKGDVLGVAELAGIMAAKRTAELIPLCHAVPLTHVKVHAEWLDTAPSDTALLQLTAVVKTTYRTGVEMEALVACSTAALTVYDMCKAVDRGMSVDSVRLLYKAGGRSGQYEHTAD